MARPGARELSDSPMRVLTRVRARGRLLIALGTIAVTAVFSYIALRDIHPGRVWDALGASEWALLIPALGAFALGTLARALRWRSLFAVGRRPPLGAVVNGMTIGYLYNNILPARAGEAARVVVLRQRSDAASVEIVATVVLERAYDVAAILVIFFLAQAWLPNVSWLHAAAVVALVLAVGLVAAAAALAIFGDRPIRLLLHPLHLISVLTESRIGRAVEDVVHGLSGLRSPRIAIEAFLWTLVAWMLTALCAYFVALATHLHLGFDAAVLVVVAVGLSMILPSPPAAIGVFEGAVLIALKPYGVPRDAALSYALVLHAVNFIPFLIVGFPLLHRNSRRGRAATTAVAATSGSIARSGSRV